MIDPRGPRFAAWITTVVLAVVLLTDSAVLLAAQAAVFALGAALVGTVATALALSAAFLNAGFGLCLGCELYLIVQRITSRQGATA
jgi:hypothetical protein